jgi:uncharacterized protein (TIGR03086 family)
MTATADRYRRLANRFADMVDRVPADRWSAASPCDGWTTRDLVSHVVDVHGMMLKPVQRQLSDAPSVDADPSAAIRSAIADVQAVLDDPEVAATEYDGFFGRTSVRETIDRFMCFDLVVHGWDLAKSAGLPYDISDDEVARVRSDVEQLGDSIRSQNVVGAAVEPPPDASDADRLLAFLGRDPAWTGA